MDSTKIARTLWATTREYDSPSKADITDARRALARILSAGIETGFPAPVEPSSDERAGQSWMDCVGAATEVTAVEGSATFALLAPAKAEGAPDLDCDLAWPTASGTKRKDRIGPLRRKSGDGRDWYLDIFESIDVRVALTRDGDAAAGLFPRSAPATDAEPAATGELATFSFWMFLLAAVLGLASITVTYGASRLTDGALAAVFGDESVAGANCRAAIATPRTTGDATEAVRAACEGVWNASWAGQGGTPENPTWEQELGAMVWGAVDVGRSASLVAPLLLSYGAIVVLILAGGLATRGTWFGALVDNRNRVSLSRVQMLCWTIVLLGGYVVIATFNIALLGSDIRDLSLSAGAGNEAAQATLADFVGFFPNLDPALWAVLGLTVAVSPFISQKILNQKPREGEPAGVDTQRVQSRSLVQGGPLDTRDSPADSRWSDLITGEEEANAHQVNVSRLQYLVITFLLLGSYLILLLRYLGSLDGTQILIASHDHVPVFPSMPPVDGTFLGLLVLSHGSYLAFKTLPATGAGGVTG